ncbi:MAG TPA: TRAP transporter TatT component family protein [Pyrinomonadaceae bacterium]|nr:TRAP transporter TatT component family protein [Pyrinomonadaceae bacterium]
MINLRKNSEILRSAMVASALVSVVLGGMACNNGAPETVSSTGSSDAKAAAAQIAEAEPLYDGREDMTKARTAVTILRQAHAADYGNYEAAWKLARAAFFVGDRTDNDTERDDMFREGTIAGKAAVQLQPNKPEGHFWLGANYGGTAAHSTLSNLSSFQDIKGEMEAVLKLDEGYQGYSAYLGLGRLYLQAPKMLGGDVGKAIDYLEKGLKLNPNNTVMRFHLAEAYETNNRDADAKKEIETIIATTPDPKYIAEHKDAVEKAKKLQEKIAADSRG